MSSLPPPSLSSSSSSPDPLNNRGDFKLNAARVHLDNLTRFKATSQGRSLASHDVRRQAEMEIDEFFYHLVGVKDALLQEINCEFHLGISPEVVTSSKVITELGQNKIIEAAARTELAKEIGKMEFDPKKKKQHPLLLIKELNNYSKHRDMLLKALVGEAGSGIIKISLINPRTNRKMKTPMMDYLDDSYKRIERWQKKVRSKITKYRPS